jgi:hypothetical protein
METLDQVVRKWAVMSQFEHDQEKYENLKNGSWICDVEDADDGSGDAILTFPDELVLLMGWKSGTILDIDCQDGKIIVKEVPNEDQSN